MDTTRLLGCRTLCRDVVCPFNYSDVVVSCGIGLGQGGESVVVPLPVVRPVLHVSLFVRIGRRNGDEHDPGSALDALGMEVGAPMEPVVDPSSPACTMAGVGVDIEDTLAIPR